MRQRVAGGVWRPCLAVLLVAGIAEGRNNIRDAFFSEYPGAVGTRIATVPSHPNHCGVCHYDFSGGGTRNPYGASLELALPSFPTNPNGRRQAVRSIENEDSDGDGFSTLVEVTNVTLYSNTPTFPGLTAVNVGSVTNVDVAEIQGFLVPVTGYDTIPPAVTVLSPNGGETLTGNAAATVQWTATDTSGIAAVDLYLSEDNGVTFRPIALGLPNSGSATWFPPNRPTTQAIMRVTATDNAFNKGHDTSDSVFTVAAPPGGIAPTTLRDFDMPGTQPLTAGTLNDPAGCAICHGNYDVAVEPYFNWQGSLMAQASLDPLFKACMTIGNQDAPDSGDLCLRCHLPRAWLRGRSIPTDGSQAQPADLSGVSCDLCHRLVDPIYKPGISPAIDAAILADLGEMAPTEFGNGMFVVDPTGARRGPFIDATGGHPIVVSPFHRDAALCGTCHDVSNTAFERDGEGNFPPNAFDTMAGSFSAHTLMPIERTYSEWLNSEYNTPVGVYAPQFGGNRDYVRTCQDCHMRAVTGRGCNFGSPPLRADLPLHDMTGGSTWLPGLLSVMYPGQVNDAALQAGIVRARYMLQQAAELDAGQEGTRLEVRVTNQTGHKLPTGYPEGRRVWLNVRFYDGSSSLIRESTVYDAQTGELTASIDSRIYEAKPGLDADTASLVQVGPGPSFHFVLNNRIYKDNRIPPRGFTNAAFESFGGGPVGHAYADGQHWDDASYAVPVGAVSAEVNLYYQSTSKEYIEFLRDKNTTDTAGEELYTLWVNHGKCPPELMATLTVPVSCPQVAADFDGDCDVDADDRDVFESCVTGPSLGPPAAGCDRADLDSDGDVDQADFGLFQRCLSGRDAPADPACQG